MTAKPDLRGLTRAAALATMTGCAAVTFAPAASAFVKDQYIEVARCVGHSQFCPTDPHAAPGVHIQALTDSLKVEFTANPNHCADMIAHIFINDAEGVFLREWGSNVVHPGESDGGYLIPVTPAHDYFIAVQAEGITGGCNPGWVDAWGGNLHVQD